MGCVVLAFVPDADRAAVPISISSFLSGYGKALGGCEISCTFLPMLQGATFMLVNCFVDSPAFQYDH